MVFIIGFPRKFMQHDAIMVAMDKLNKVSHFVVIKSIGKEINIA